MNLAARIARAAWPQSLRGDRDSVSVCEKVYMVQPRLVTTPRPPLSHITSLRPSSHHTSIGTLRFITPPAQLINRPLDTPQFIPVHHDIHFDCVTIVPRRHRQWSRKLGRKRLRSSPAMSVSALCHLSSPASYKEVLRGHTATFCISDKRRPRTALQIR